MILVAQILGIVFFLLAIVVFILRPENSLVLYVIPGWALLEICIAFVAGVCFTYLSFVQPGWEVIWIAVSCWLIVLTLIFAIWYVNWKKPKIDEPQ